MERKTVIWLILFLLGGLFLIGRAFFTEHGMSKAYVRAVEINAEEPDPDNRWVRYENATPRDYAEAEAKNPNQSVFMFSLSRTIGIWVVE